MPQHLRDLVEMAKEPSSAKRRELLREITDVFFEDDPRLAGPERDLYGDIMAKLSAEMDTAVRAELAKRMAAEPGAPRTLIRQLARDDIAVSAPVLAASPVLTETDLVELASSYDQGRLRAISQRPQVPVAVSDTIVERGDDKTLGVLLQNQGAAFSRHASEAAVERAQENEDLHEAVVRRADLPPDLLNELYFTVEQRLRQEIIARNENLAPEVLEAALAAGRARIRPAEALPRGYATLAAQVRDQIKMGMMAPSTLAALMRRDDRTKFMIALSELAGVDYPVIARIFAFKNIDSLAVVCKAAGFDRALYLTLVILMLGQDGNAMGQAREYGDLYNQLGEDTAMRTIRFWRLRKESGAKAA
ncbi:MAG: DUF2336 domain-containing protein [Caulobacteraceae bacterium]